MIKNCLYFNYSVSENIEMADMVSRRNLSFYLLSNEGERIAKKKCPDA
jgi:hypothetical protein